MAKRKQTPYQELRKDTSNNNGRMSSSSRRSKKVNSTLLILGSVLIFSLSLCPAVHMMSTTVHIVNDESLIVQSPSGSHEEIPSPPSRLNLDQELRLRTPSLLVDHGQQQQQPVPTISGNKSLVIESKDLVKLGIDEKSAASFLDQFDRLGDDDKLAISLGTGFQWPGGALALENVNNSESLGKLLEGMMGNAGSLGNSTLSGIFRHGAVSSSSSDDLFLIPKKLLVETFETAEEKWLNTMKLLDERFSQKKGADAKGPIGTAFAFNAPNEESLALSNNSALLEYASKQFLSSLESAEKLERRRRRLARSTVPGLTFEGDENENVVQADLQTLHTRFIRQSLNNMAGPDSLNCGLNEETLPCDLQTKFRSFSGWCNNVRHPAWGKSVITFDRMVASMYDDGISVPRSRSVTGIPLPSPRIISSNVHIDVSHLSNRHTLLLMEYAQFIDHDITFTPVHKGPEGKILNCRDCDSTQHTHPECWPIRVPQGDSYYPPMNMDSGRAYCIPFTRSLPGQQRLGPREQINQNSAYLDSSQIYGENLCKSLTLRAPGGKLNVTGHPVHGAKPLMPQITFLKECKSPSGYCFFAGDARASEQPALAAMHTVFLRAHNNWADGMRAVNPHFDEDRIYQEVRRIMIAVNQHIIYSELLPRLMGNAMINAYGLSLQDTGYYGGYDPNCPANIYNEFSTAAFRFGHSLIRPNLPRMDNRYNGMSPHIALRDGFFNSDMLYHPLMVDELMRGLIGEPMEQLDPFITKEVTNHLFEDKRKQFSGMDLISLNIHRGRDHGLPGYNNYREVCGLKRAVTFQDLGSEIPQDVLTKLQETYASVDDIDLFTGSISERPVAGGILGPTMTCVIGTQFKRLRQCDRFWYETNDPQIRFTPQQLAEIRKMTISKMICDNLDMPGEIQRSGFDAPHNILNPRIPCDRLPALNLEAWREAPPNTQSQVRVRQCNIGGKIVDVGGSALPSPCVSCVCSPEGTRCASLRITSCPRLFEEARREEIVKDNICMSQCGFMLNNNKLGSTGRSQHPNSIFNNFVSRVARPLRRPL